MGRRVSDPAVPPLATVRLLRLPVAVHARAQEHSDEVQRELQLIAEQVRDDESHGGASSVPVRLVQLVQTLTSQYSSFTAEQESILEQAIDRGDREIELTFQVPNDVGPAAQHLSDLLDEVDDYCRAGRHLLTLATPAELVTYRRWYLDEFIGQAGGREPIPWPQYASAS